MPESGPGTGDVVLWLAVAAAAIAVIAGLFFWRKGRRLPGQHVYRASRMSRGNLLFPTQVAVTPTSVVHFTPQIVGGREHSMHIAHVASVLIDRNLFFSNVVIESSGGTSPVRCYGHHKADAIEMKRMIEQYQSDYYRGRDRGTEPGRPA
jgi:LPXTG-motif cell wall-anchored protein